jgi:hypothetical protein
VSLLQEEVVMSLLHGDAQEVVEGTHVLHGKFLLEGCSGTYTTKSINLNDKCTSRVTYMLPKKVCNFVLFCKWLKTTSVERKVITTQILHRLMLIKMQAFTSCKVDDLDG